MECNQLKSVLSLVDALVRSAHDRRSRMLSPGVPVHAPSLAPVSSKSSTDFSICSILGQDNDVTQYSPSSENHSETSPPLTPYSDCTSPRPSHRVTSPPVSAHFDSDCDNKPDQLPTDSEQPPRKKRQRTTFSPLEVLELERAFRRRPYLTSEDEEELVQRLGIPFRSLKYWFQNRRAKSRKLEKKMSVYQTSPSNQFELAVRHSRRLQFVSRSPADHWKHVQGERVPCPAMENCFEDHPHSRPIKTVSHHSSVKSNQFRGGQSFPLPMFHPGHFNIRPAEPARRLYSRASQPRFQPY